MAISTLKEVYVDEMRDLWSANDQMQKFMKNLSAKASDQKLKNMLDELATGIGKHTETLKSISKQPAAARVQNIAGACRV